MAKLTPWILDLLAGKAGDMVVWRRGKGVYVRARVRPRNPKTPLQEGTRKGFQAAAAVAAWKALPEADKDAYRKRAAREGRTGYQLFLSTFLQSDAALEEP